MGGGKVMKKIDKAGEKHYNKTMQIFEGSIIVKKLKKFLAVLLALIMALGISAAAADIPAGLDLDGLPELTLGTTTGVLEAEATELWYRFTAEEGGYYRLTVDGPLIYYDVYFLVVYKGETKFSPADKGMASISAGETQYVRIYKHEIANDPVYGDPDADREFTVTIEGPYSLRTIMGESFALMFAQFSDVGIVGLLAGIGDLPFAFILFGLFFAPLSMGATLIISLLGVLMLPLTLIFSPFMLIDTIKNWFK